MKQYVLKLRLQGLICIFIISVMLTGCVGTTVTAPESYEVFSPQYYILKKVDNSDYDKLKKLQLSKNPQTAASAGLILGMHYLRYDNDTVKAEPLLVDNYNSSDLDPYMKRIGELWLMELEIAKNRGEEARSWADKVRLLEKEPATDEALQTYCTVMRIYPGADLGFYNCVEERLKTVSGSEPQAVAAVTEPEPKEMLDGTLDILVTSAADPQDVSGGVYFYAKKHDMNHRIRMSKSYREGEWDFIADIDNAYLAGRGYSVDFKPDVSGLLMDMRDYAALNECGKVLIGYGSGLREQANALAAALKSEILPNPAPATRPGYANETVGTVDISDSGTARRIRDYLAEWDQRPFCAVGAGTEDEINNFTPSVRQYIRHPDTQRIFMVETVDTGKHYSAEYLTYYANTYMFPVIDLNLNPETVEFAAEYKEFSGLDLTYEALMGYDMMHYIHMQTPEGKEVVEPYRTNIIGFDENKAVRAVRAFYINSQGGAEPVVFEAYVE